MGDEEVGTLLETVAKQQVQMKEQQGLLAELIGIVKARVEQN